MAVRCPFHRWNVETQITSRINPSENKGHRKEGGNSMLSLLCLFQNCNAWQRHYLGLPWAICTCFQQERVKYGREVRCDLANYNWRPYSQTWRYHMFSRSHYKLCISQDVFRSEIFKHSYNRFYITPHFILLGNSWRLFGLIWCSLSQCYNHLECIFSEFRRPFF